MEKATLFPIPYFQFLSQFFKLHLSANQCSILNLINPTSKNIEKYLKKNNFEIFLQLKPTDQKHPWTSVGCTLVVDDFFTTIPSENVVGALAHAHTSAAEAFLLRCTQSESGCVGQSRSLVPCVLVPLEKELRDVSGGLSASPVLHVLLGASEAASSRRQLPWPLRPRHVSRRATSRCRRRLRKANSAGDTSDVHASSASDAASAGAGVASDSCVRSSSSAQYGAQHTTHVNTTRNEMRAARASSRYLKHQNIAC